MKHVYIMDGNWQYMALYRELGYFPTTDMKQADLLAFTGGEDVTPSLYGESRHRSTCSNSYRDEAEEKVFLWGCKYSVPMVGICRGGQFLNVMNGGKLWQDVNNHAVSNGHEATDVLTGDRGLVSSTHHQMMRPTKEAQILMTAREATYLASDREVTVPDREDVEAVIYWKTLSLCFQPHPEYQGWGWCSDKFRGYVNELIGV